MNTERRAIGAVEDVLCALRVKLGVDVAYVGQLIGQERVVTHIAANHAGVALLGAPMRSADSYCGRIASGKLPSIVHDAKRDVEAARLAETADLQIADHIGVPIYTAGGEVFGSLCCFNRSAGPAFTDCQLELVSVCAEIIANMVRVTPDSKHRQIATVIATQAADMHYQPIYRLSDEKLVCLEALARFTLPPFQSPEKWLIDAETVGLRIPLEFMTARKALAALGSIPASASLAINLSPGAIMSPCFRNAFGGDILSRIVLEITEHAEIANYAELRGALADFRANGLRLAIDDVGAGYASFRHVVELLPDIIKLDMYLIRNIHKDRARLALVNAITQYSRATGCEVVAEGVEIRPELEALRQVGITTVQGYLVGRPQPLPNVRKIDPWLQRDGNFAGELCYGRGASL